MYKRVCSLLADLSYFPDLALTLTSAHMSCERSKSVHTLIHESQRSRNKADGLYLTTPKKTYQPVKAVSYSGNATNCDVFAVMQFIHYLRNTDN